MTGPAPGGAAAPDAALSPPAPVVVGSVGILGGTFDPVHHGHLAIAEEVRETLGLERLLLIPAADPPHKPDRPVTSPSDLAAALAGSAP